MKNIEDKITTINNLVFERLNSGEKRFSSEKSIVFDFAWQFLKKYSSYILDIDFETKLFDNFSDGTFLDLFINLRIRKNTYKIGIEFKFPLKKGGQTEARQKIINDLKRVTWLVEKNKIDLGVFLCYTDEVGYINEGNYTEAIEFITHNLKKFQKGKILPVNEKYKEVVHCLNDIEFKWGNIERKRNKYIIPENKFSFLNPIFVRRS